jgi:O-antigen ligase
LGACGSAAITSGVLTALFDPALVLVAALGLVFVILSMLRPVLPLLALVAIGPLEGVSVALEGALSPAKMIGALCLASFIANATMTGRRIVLDHTHTIVLALFALAMLSSLQARDPALGLQTALRYGSFVVLFVLVTQFAGQDRVLRAIVWTLSVSAAVAAVLGLSFYLSGAFFVATLPYSNPNDYAFMLATTLPLTVWLTHSEKKARWLAVLMVTVVGAATLLSFSRGALLGLAAWVAWTLVSARRRLMPMLLAIAVVGGGFILAIRSDPARFQTGIEMKGVVANKNVDTRIAAWKGAVSLIAQRPLLGVGPGNYRLHFFEVTGRPPGTENPFVVHNAYLDVATELGLPAGILFVAYVVTQLARARHIRRQGRRRQGLAEGLQGGLIVAVVGALTLSQQYFAPLWLLGAMITCLWVTSATVGKHE